MPVVLRQQLIRITVGGRLVFTSGDRLITNYSIRIAEQDRGSQCSFEIYDPGLRLGNLLYERFQALGGILTPEGLLEQINNTPPQGETPTGGTPNVNGYPQGDELARLLISECKRYKVTQREQIAYVLGTVEHESAMGRYLEEIASGQAYEGRRDIGNTQPGDGIKFKGRGYGQITGKIPYTYWGKRLNIDLVGNPALAAEPKYAIPILILGMKEGSFTGRKLSDYINNTKTNFREARRIINGMDRANLIAGYARKWLGRLDELGYSSDSNEQPQSARNILNSLGASANNLPQSSNQSTEEVTFKQGTIIKFELGFNDSAKSFGFEYYLTGIKLTEPATTRITGKQLRFILAQSGKINAVNRNTGLNQLATKIKHKNGIKIQSPTFSYNGSLIQQNESNYQALVKLAKESGLFVRGDTRTIKLEPLTIGDRSFTLTRPALLPGSFWADEASSSRIIKDSVVTNSNLGAKNANIKEESPPIDLNSPLSESIGKGFQGQLFIDPLRFPSVLEIEPGHIIKLSPKIGYGAALARNFRVGEVTHTRNNSTIDIYLPVGVKIQKTVPVAGNQPSANSLDGLVNKPGSSQPSFSGKFQTPLKRGETIAGYRVTSPYGYRIHPIYKTRKLHGGVDVGCPTGTPYYAICKPGETVKLTRAYSDVGGYMAIFDYDGYRFYYLHCSQVAANGTYGYGQVIAKCGSTGSSTAPHLHFTQKELNPTETVDPMRGYVYWCLTGKSPG